MGTRENEFQISQNYILHKIFSEFYLCEIFFGVITDDKLHLPPLKNVKKEGNIVWIILVQGFCPLKIKIT